MRNQDIAEVLRGMLLNRTSKDFRIQHSTNLITDLGLASDEGLDLALEIEDHFHITIPKETNPIVNEEKRCGATFAELVELVGGLINA